MNFNSIPWMIVMHHSEKPTGVVGRRLTKELPHKTSVYRNLQLNE